MRSLRALQASLLIAVAVPPLIGYNLPPSATFFNQTAAIAAWGLVAAFTVRGGGRNGQRRGAWILALALAPLACGIVVAGTAGHLPSGLTLCALAFVAAAALVAWAGAHTTAVESEHAAAAALDSFFVAWTLAGLASAAIAAVQVFLPDVPDGTWITRSNLLGRAIGNIRQPNHLSAVLLWATVALVPLQEGRRIGRAMAAVLMTILMLGLALSASRIGIVGIAALALWGVFDKRLAKPSRALLVATPALFGIVWWAMTVWAGATHQTFGAAARLAEHEFSPSRWIAWRNAVDLVRQQPWGGVGYGEFNFAWTLTPFPGRSAALFDNAHNLPLHLAVELGVPSALVMTALLGVALWQAGQRAWFTSAAQRAALVGVVIVCLHSLVEFPLWYAYFLLPTAWAWGTCLGAGRAAARSEEAASRAPAGTRWLVLGGIAMVVGTLMAAIDYWRVVDIFAPGEFAEPLEQRIARGQRSIFFAHQADFAAGTSVDHPSQAMAALSRASHNLLDARLMQAWAVAFAEAGDLDRARYVAARLREFDSPQAQAFFAGCEQPTSSARPFQCDPPSRPLGWRDFR